MTITTRIAVAVAALFAVGALAFTLVPAGTANTDCGWWFSPEWDRDESRELATSLAGFGDEASAMVVARNWRECDEALSTRRNVSLGLLGAGVLIPGAVVFVGRGRRSK